MSRSLPSLVNRPIVLVAGLFAVLAAPSMAASGHVWMHKSSIHFTVTYDESTAPLADKSLAIAEATAARLTGVFGWKFDGDRVAILLTDDDDYSNGASYGRTGLVQIQCRKVPMEWRDETRWLETVLSHELSHVYTLAQLQRPITSSFGWRDHSDAGLGEYGYGSITGTDEIPRWFVEGMAQIGSERFKADGRDPLREVLLGDAYRSRLLLGWQRMSRFEGTSREYELVYNQGFDFLLFLRDRYPNADFATLCGRMRSDGFMDGFASVFGKPLSTLYAEWFASLAARFPSVARDSAGRKLADSDEGVLLAESGASGRWMVANWMHDYLRFDLFEMESGGQARRRAFDVGEKVVVDSATGSVWYSALLRNTGKGADQYDIFRRDKDGSTTRETRGARSIAFDVRGDQLVYAKYHAGVTTVVRRTVSSGREIVLHAFPYDTAVYEIAIGSPDSVLLDLGTGDARRAALSTKGGIRILWDCRASVRSVAPWRDDTLVFVAVDSGAPRLMWSKGEGEWHRFAANDAVREVWVDRADAEPRLLASVHENGGRRVRALDGDWVARSEIVSKGSVEGMAPSLLEKTVPAVGLASEAPWIRMPVHLAFGHSITRRSDAEGRYGNSSWYAMVSEELTDPTRKHGLGMEGGGGLFPSGEHLSSYLPVFSAWGWYGDGDWSLRLSYSYEASEYSQQDSALYEVDRFGMHTIEANAGWTLSREWLASIHATHLWRTVSYTVGAIDGSGQTRTGDVGTIVRVEGLRGSLEYARGDSRMDPAALGSPGFGFWSNGTVGRGEQMSRGAWRPAKWAVSGRTGVGTRSWLPGDVASLSEEVDLYGVAGGIDGGLQPLPGTTVSMGGDGPFRGYADDELKLRSWARGVAELRVSPFAKRGSGISWSDRTRLGARIEAGWIQYLSMASWQGDNGGVSGKWIEKGAYAASLDFSLRQGFYWWSPDQSWIEIGYARPLARFDFGRRNDPYRFFFELQLR